MLASKTDPTPPAPRLAARLRVLDAAERLLRSGDAGFSMRDLAAEAEVSFATPFNQFGSKGGIMQALSGRRIDAMVDRFAAAEAKGDAADRVLVAVGIAAAVMLAEPEVNRAVIGTIGAPGGAPGQALARSRMLWSKAIGDADGFDPGSAELARSVLPRQLAVAFRGVLSFWTSGEIGDAELAREAREAASIPLLGFVGAARRSAMLAGVGAP